MTVLISAMTVLISAMTVLISAMTVLISTMSFSTATAKKIKIMFLYKRYRRFPNDTGVNGDILITSVW